jgi:hypothetical protein
VCSEAQLRAGDTVLRMSLFRRASDRQEASDQPQSASPRVPRVGVVPIGDFYKADERRRSSIEKRLGMDWYDVDGFRYELSWIHDTGELYLMSESNWTMIPGPGAYATGYIPSPQALVIATIPSGADVDSVLSGWRDAMRSSAGVGWVLDQIPGAIPDTDR